eukprot:gene24282-32718_t
MIRSSTPVEKEESGKKVPIRPTYMTTRPNKRVNFEKPACFVMGPSLLKEVAVSTSLEHFLSSVIALEDNVISLRLKKTRAGDLDHILILFTPSEEFSVIVHAESAKRYAKVIPSLQAMAGAANFQKRVDKFKSHWDQWDEAESCMWLGRCSQIQKDNRNTTTTTYTNSFGSCCGCRYISFETYCQEFDQLEQDHSSTTTTTTTTTIASNIPTNSNNSSSTINTPGNTNTNTITNDNSSKELLLEESLLLLTREMMYKLLSCNRFFGMDGFTYDANGTQLGDEFLTVNFPMERIGQSDKSNIHTVFLSEIEKFKTV